MWVVIAVVVSAAIVVALVMQVDLEDIVGTLGGTQLTDTPAPGGEGIALGDDSLPFIENVGQFGKAVRFQVSGNDRTIWLAQDAVWVTLLDQSLPLSQDSQETGDRDLQGVNVKLSFSGANPAPRLEPFNRLDVRVSYLIGNDPVDWYTDVPVWGGVRYVDLYPGVDLEITGGVGCWYWQLVTRDPEFDLSDVRLQVDGVSDMTLESQAADAGQRVRLSTDVGEFVMPLLAVAGSEGVAVQDDRQILNPFISFDAQLAFDQSVQQSVTAPDDAADLLYATFLGGSGSDDIEALAVDQTGSVYVMGNTRSDDFPTTPGAYDAVHNGDYDAVVVKLDSTGSRVVYIAFVGGGQDDRGHGIAVDKEGSAYIAGSTNSSDFPATSGALDATCGTDGNCNPNYRGLPNDDAFVAKLSPAGSALEYATFLGGSDSDNADSIALDQQNNVYVVGDTRSDDFYTTAGAFGATHIGSYDVFVAKLNDSGTALEYATYVGGSADDNGEDIALDETTNVYVTGFTDSENFTTTPGAVDETCTARDVFVFKLNSAGSVLEYATCLGGVEADYGRALAVDEQGSAYVTGSTFSPDFFTTPGAFDTTFEEGDMFVVKLDPGGAALVYTTFLGGGQGEFGRGDIALDQVGSAYIVGDTQSADFPTTPDAFDGSHNGSYDTIVAKLNRNGSALAYATFLGGVESDRARAVAVDGAGNIYVAGYTTSADFPTTQGAFDTTYNGDDSHDDAFVARFKVPVLYYEVSGRVLDGAGHPLVGVTVSDDVGHATNTDKDGYYTLGELERGIYVIVPSKEGYTLSSSARIVSVPPDAAGQDFILTPAAVSVTLAPGLAARLVYTDAYGLLTELQMPVDAVAQTTTLVLTPTMVAGGKGLASVGYAFDLVAFQGEKALLDFEFDTPITAYIHYRGADVQTISDESQLTLRRQAVDGWVDAAKTCEPPSVYDRHPGDGWLAVAVCQPGRFGLFGPTHQVYLPLVLKGQ